MSYCGRIVGPGPRVPERVGFAKLAPRRRWALPIIFTLLLALAVFILPAVPQEEPSARNVLILNSFTNRDSFIELEPFKASVRAHLSMPVNFNIEYLESISSSLDPIRRCDLSWIIVSACLEVCRLFLSASIVQESKGKRFGKALRALPPPQTFGVL